ncbi:ABC transporter permease [Candidatus Calescamantes bacterium]|nr:ABC transporter permease [Candidatus Calescamantes bacterium]MCK5598790.1 ABC transporter permease [bacterium]
MFFKFALKNILRYKRRTFLTFAVLSFAVGMYMWMAGVLKGFDDMSVENLINFETGHFKIRTIDFDEEILFSKDNFVTGYEAVIEKLKKLPFVTSIATRLTLRGELDNGLDSKPCMAYGIDAQEDHKVFNLNDFVSKGSLTPGGVILGRDLAKDMKVDTGDLVYFTFRTAQGMIDSIELEVSGILNAPDPLINSSTLFMNIGELQGFIELPGVTEIAMKTVDFEKYKKYQPELEKALPGLAVLSWRKLGESFFNITTMKKRGQGIFIMFIAIIGLVGIINTMLMSVLEKKKEIGTMKALGMTDGEVQKIFVWEGFLVGVFGAIFGLILGALFMWYFLVKGFDISAFTGGDASMDVGYKVMGIVKAKWDIASIVTSMTGCVIASVVASFIPAKKTTKLQPAECLRTNQ